MEALRIISDEHQALASILHAIRFMLKEVGAGRLAPDLKLFQAMVHYLDAYAEQRHHPREDPLFIRLAERSPEAADALARLAEQHAAAPARIAVLQQAGTMSGGERLMLAVGRALMARPKLLMLDEPSLGLAPLIVREIFRIIAELRRRGVSILLVEQNARAALQVADYAYVLEMGAVAMQGPARELADDPRVVEAYLGLGSKHQAMLST